MRRLRAPLLLVVLLGVPAFFLGRVRTEPDVPLPALAGQVLDEDGPVAGALVRIKGTAGFTRSDADGRFRLPVPSRPGRVTATKDGYLIGGTASDAEPLIIRLERIPEGDCERYEWVNPTPDPKRPNHCGNCHRAIHDEWASGGHARSASSRHFTNLYDGTDWHGRPGVGWNLLKEHPDGAGVCAACHAPTVRPSPLADFDLRPAAKQLGPLAGVHCDYCHKVSGPGSGEYGLTHGRYQLELRRPDPDEGTGQLFFGPLDDVDRGEDVYSPFQRDSRLCAACHEGTVFGVHVYGTYSEWLESPARVQGRQCQDCHMAPTGKLTNIAPGRGGIRRDPKTLANHVFFAGSQADMLRRCLRLEAAARPDGGGWAVAVRVTAEGVGHRVPTGFADRQVLLVVEGTDAEGKPVSPQAGPRLPGLAGKALAGKAGRLYAKVLQDFDGRSPAPFWRAAPEFADSRLKPGATDASEYRFPAGVRSVRVRLLHRRFWQDVADEKGWPDNETAVAERVIGLGLRPE